MKAKWPLIVIGIIVIIGIAVGIWWYRQAKSSTQSSQTQSTSSAPQPTTSPSKTQDIHTADPAQLLLASYSRNLNTTDKWQDSPVTSEYHDFNGDGVPDAFVWAKLPGTAGNSFAAVWTTGSDGKPIELWYLQEQFYLGHSTWSVNSDNGLVNTSVNGDGSIASINTFHWQVTSTGKGFVLEPNM